MGRHQIWAWPICTGCSTWQTSAARTKIWVLSLPESSHLFEPSLLPPSCLLQPLNSNISYSLCPHPNDIQLPSDRASRERCWVVGSGIRLNLSNVPQRLLQQLVSGLRVGSIASLCLAAGESLVTASSFPSWGWASSSQHAPELRKSRYFLKVPTQLPQLCMKPVVLASHDGPSTQHCCRFVLRCLHALSQCLLVPRTKPGMTSARRNSTRQRDV